MKTTLFYAIEGGSVDRKTGIISGVSVITQGEAKGHGVKIDRKTLETFKARADEFPGGVRVKADHGTGFASIVGMLDGFRIDGEKLRADLRLLKSDSHYEKTMDMAESMPSIFGLSPSFSQITEKVGGELFARCQDLYSVDLVDAPAANPSGLYSSIVDSENINRMSDIKEFVSGLFGKDGTITELQTHLAATRTDLSAAQLEATNLKTKNSELTAELSKRDASLTAVTKERDDFKAIIDKPDGEIEKRAGLKAREIVVKQFGQAALEIEPGKATGDDIIAQYNAITDPVLRTEWYRKNKAAYDAAFTAKANQQPPRK